MVRAMVHSIKHVVQFSIASLLSGNVRENVIATAVARQDVDLPTEVQEGSSIKAVYLEYWYIGDGATTSELITAVAKIPTSGAGMTAGELQAIQTYPNKKNIFEIHQGLLGKVGTNPVNVFRHWIKIPKGKQRFGLGDKLSVNSFAGGADFFLCGFATFKEYM